MIVRPVRPGGALLPPGGWHDEEAPTWHPQVSELIDGPPHWFPYGVPIEAPWQIPVIKAPTLNGLPVDGTAFDRRGGVDDLNRTLLHFYVRDTKLRSQLYKPWKFVSAFEGAGAVVAPDFSIRDDAPLDMRVFAVRMSRSVGAFYQSRGVTVVPNVRWGGACDFDFCFAGIEHGSAIAVSNHGCWRRGEARLNFLSGLPALLERVEPKLMYIHGTMNHPVLRDLQRKVEVRHVTPDRTRARKVA